MASRKDIRAQLKTLLQTGLVGTGKPAQVVYGGQIADFQGQSPVVVIASAGTERRRMTFEGGRAVHHFKIFVFVLYKDAAAGWDEEDAEDKMDEIEDAIAGILDANAGKCSYWQALSYDRASECAGVPVAGEEYRVETIPVVVQAY